MPVLFMQSLTPRKVAGNFHFTTGESVYVIGGGHAHNSGIAPADKINFTHRIERLTFGDELPGISYPLDSTEQISEAENGKEMFTYFLTIVPTQYSDIRGKTLYTYQYSVREYKRMLDKSKAKNGIPGIFFKYDISDVKVHIEDVHSSLLHFFVNLCGVVGGVFATSGIFHRMSRKIEMYTAKNSKLSRGGSDLIPYT